MEKVSNRISHRDRHLHSPFGQSLMHTFVFDLRSALVLGGSPLRQTPCPIAQCTGFEYALRAQCNVPPSTILNVNRFFQCCKVHFQRSEARVACNGLAMPAGSKDVLTRTAWDLTEPQSLETFKARVRALAETFPNCQAWLAWHVSRGEYILQALSSCSETSWLFNNTNAQGSLGWGIQRNASKKRTTIVDTMHHAIRCHVRSFHQ
ncbi:hypothetical protein K470DRAFT_9628 [Piedraia hortae CBS 480.64]|uniref:Uncharacterized protein n=1 Tax=Piedraia hortae CBS 480.64 TaxID=1314780 RepID=A0A6A7C561_9PEZI|nr:hypothetical protein K470DRAFT_9628 [Piedraia hortae CBS 480.64]